ncbi:hypothetical protein EDB86DRAFT_2833854 [Lactarius hatsudake]|nr:hypothetical protein EDB86DRAFT_2833854 [Lactarius hatsudake]
MPTTATPTRGLQATTTTPMRALCDDACGTRRGASRKTTRMTPTDGAKMVTITARVSCAKTTPTAVRPRLRPLNYRNHDHDRNHVNYRDHDRGEVAGDKAAAEGTRVGTAGDDGNGNAAGLAMAEAAVLLDIFLLA